MDCHPITFDERVSVDLDTAEIQPCMRFFFFFKKERLVGNLGISEYCYYYFYQWISCTVYETRKYGIWQNQL